MTENCENPIFSISWSPKAPRIIATGGSNGELTLYKLMADRFEKISTFKPYVEYSQQAKLLKEKKKKKGDKRKGERDRDNKAALNELSLVPHPIFCVSFSSASPFLACGDDSGWVYVFELPSSLSQEQESDLQLLDSLGKERQ